ncbi:MAG TPA: aminoglycoside phosphotransferase family protein [Gaiella sp.]
MQIPKALGAEWPHEREWLERLPRLAAECAAAWDLELEEPFDTPRSLVVPAGGAVLKLNAPSHFEADHEADALACWDGRGAVRLLARDDGRRALLLERCVPGVLLAEKSADEVSITAGLLERLPGAAPTAHSFRLLADEADRWMEEVPRRWEGAGKPFERSLLEAAIDVLGSVDRGATRLVNQDLHAWNVLRAEREPWLVIDPKPLVGEREVDGVGPLRNAGFAGDPGLVRRWLDALADLGMDRERLRGWGLAHALAWGFDHGRWSARSIEAARTISRA